MSVTGALLLPAPTLQSTLTQPTNQVPAGWASESVLVLVSDTDEQTEAMFGMPPGGINHAVQRWGDTLLSYHGGKQRSAVGSSDADRASLRAKYFGYVSPPCSPPLSPPLSPLC